MRELNYAELKRSFDDDVDRILKNAPELPGSFIIGQERAEKAIELGLRVKDNKYNIYISGETGLGKQTFAKKFAERIAGGESVPPDICYVYNFDNPKIPNFIRFPAKSASAFKADFDDLINHISAELRRYFESAEFELEKADALKKFADARGEIIDEITKNARELNFGVKMSQGGVYFVPIVDGEVVSEEQFDALPEDRKSEITAQSEIIQQKSALVMQRVRKIDADAKKQVEDLEYKNALIIVGLRFSRIMREYEGNERAVGYLTRVKEDLLENFRDFIEDEEEDEDSLAAALPWIPKKNKEDFLYKYKVNLFIDNSELSGAPVICEHYPTFANLAGEIEFDSEFGNLTTDFMKIKPGALHKANGGYLILQAQDLLGAPGGWETVKRVLKCNELEIGPLKEYLISVAAIRPEAYKIDVKVILIGSRYLYDILADFDEDFLKYFQIHSVFDYEMKADDGNILEIVGFARNYCKERALLECDPSAFSALLEYASRLCGDQRKLSIEFGKLAGVLLEAAAFAPPGERLTAGSIKTAIREQEARKAVYEEKMSEMIENDYIMIDTEGAKIAQINGLAVLESDGYAFAKPSRITATTYIGKAGIIDVEREAKMSGAIHTKGVQVITGYLGQKYAQDFPLSLSCRVCMEQNYNGVDGDSASSTELYCILSSLAELPVSQELAVTGSVNQRGEIQPIGGVNYKIEGFFDVCRRHGLTGTQGVIIPKQNAPDLCLRENVIEAVKNGEFHIFAIENVDEGIELLMRTDAKSAHDRVFAKLREYNEKQAAEKA